LNVSQTTSPLSGTYAMPFTKPRFPRQDLYQLRDGRWFY
jgi:hypothetical protein